MKMRTIYLSCMALMSLAIMSCSDDSDKIDDFFKEKIARLEENNAEVAELYANAVVFVKDDYDATIYISADRIEMEEQINEDRLRYESSRWRDHNYDPYCLYNLAPSTTYYYVLYRGIYQTSIDYGTRGIYSKIKSFTTPEFTAGSIEDIGDTYVKIKIPLWEHDSYRTTTCYMHYSTEQGFSPGGPNIASNDSYFYSDQFRINANGLSPNTTYYYRLQYQAADGQDYYSKEGSFRTLSK